MGAPFSTDLTQTYSQGPRYTGAPSAHRATTSDPDSTPLPHTQTSSHCHNPRRIPDPESPQNTRCPGPRGLADKAPGRTESDFSALTGPPRDQGLRNVLRQPRPLSRRGLNCPLPGRARTSLGCCWASSEDLELAPALGGGPRPHTQKEPSSVEQHPQSPAQEVSSYQNRPALSRAPPSPPPLCPAK